MHSIHSEHNRIQIIESTPTAAQEGRKTDEKNKNLNSVEHFTILKSSDPPEREQGIAAATFISLIFIF